MLAEGEGRQRRGAMVLDQEPSDLGPGLPPYGAAASRAAPRYLETDRIIPLRTVGLDARTTLKATFWHTTIEEIPQLSDPGFVSIAPNLAGGRVWRNAETRPTEVGAIAMQPFEGAGWRFEGAVGFVHLYVPYRVLAMVCESLFGRELRHSDLRMAAAVGDGRLCGAAQSIQGGLRSVEPTNLILDSWALVLAEILVRRFSSHAERPVRGAPGRIPARGVAHVIDFVEAGIGHDLSLESLAAVAAMSPFHFARRFRETVGVSPHAYVLARRVRHARAMLKRGHAGLADIAAACGFSSQAHFTTAFHRHVGVTPGAYRRAVAD